MSDMLTLSSPDNEEYILPTITLGDLAEENITIGEQKKQDVLFMKRVSLLISPPDSCF